MVIDWKSQKSNHVKYAENVQQEAVIDTHTVLNASVNAGVLWRNLENGIRQYMEHIQGEIEE